MLTIHVSQGLVLHTTQCISEDNFSVVFLRMLNWISLTEIDELIRIKEKSFQKPQVLFKHSTRCGTSSLVLNRLERAKEIPEADFYFLDLIRYRDVSDKIADLFNVYHESPQVLLIKNGKCHYEESHLGIDMFELNDQVTSLN